VRPGTGYDAALGPQPTARVGAGAAAFSPIPYRPTPPPFCSTRASTVAMRPASMSTSSTVDTSALAAVSARVSPTDPVVPSDPVRPASTTPAADCLSAAAMSTTACARSTAESLARRSEEHTSELQSRENLVCRLLLEKKKKTAQRSEPADGRR